MQPSTAIRHEVYGSHRRRVSFLLDSERGLVRGQPALESLHGSRCGFLMTDGVARTNRDTAISTILLNALKIDVLWVRGKREVLPGGFGEDAIAIVTAKGGAAVKTHAGPRGCEQSWGNDRRQVQEREEREIEREREMSSIRSFHVSGVFGVHPFKRAAVSLHYRSRYYRSGRLPRTVEEQSEMIIHSLVALHIR